MSILPFALVCGCAGNLSQLHARAGDNALRLICQTNHPADIVAPLKHVMKFVPRLASECFKQFRG